VQDYRENEPKQFLGAPENAQIKDYLKRVFMHQGGFSSFAFRNQAKAR
jgi:hypothetical protein